MIPQNSVDSGNEHSKNAPQNTPPEVRNTAKNVADHVSQIVDHLPEEERSEPYEERREREYEQLYINNRIEEASRNPQSIPEFLQDDTVVRNWLLQELQDPKHMWTQLQGVGIQVGNITRHNGYILVEITRTPPEGKQKHNTLLLEIRSKHISLQSTMASALFTSQYIKEKMNSNT